MKRNLLFTMFAFLTSIVIINAQTRSGSELYSQMADGYSEWDYVYSFEMPGMPEYDTYGADDFQVPTGETWDIWSVKCVMKTWDNITTMNVSIYTDDNGAPGTEIHNFNNIASNVVTNMPQYAVFEIETTLPSTVSLTEGIYWISISAVASFDYFNWLYQMNTTTNLSQTHVINPGGGNWLPTVWTPNVNWNGYYNATFALYAPPVPNDLTVTAINSPVSGELTATENIEIVIANVGSADQATYDVQYQIDGGTAVVETVTTTIASNQSYTHVFGTTEDMSALGDYTVDVAVVLAGDENPDNDDMQVTVTNFGPIYELTSTSTSETTCSGLFTDAGGLFNGFTVNDGGTITFHPETTGSRVELDFTEFDLGYSPNNFKIYDGETTSDNLLYTYIEEGAAWGQYNDPPSYVRARNANGTLTIELDTYDWLSEEVPGWVANIGCMIPENIDFTILGLELGEEFLHEGMPTNVGTRIVNSGGSDQSRVVNLLEDGVIVETITSNTLVPGEVQDIVFNWYPTVVGYGISLSVEVEPDPGATNDDNSIEVFVDIFSQFALIESFEGESLIPEYWTVKMGAFSKASWGAFHGNYLLTSVYNSPNDTLITPLLMIQPNELLRFEAKGYNKDFNILYSQSQDGPWTALENYPNALVNNWAHFETNLSSLAGGNYYLGFAFTDNGAYSGQFSIDLVSGPDKKFFNQNLSVFDDEVNQFPAIGREAFYQLTIKNMGLEAVNGSDYVVHLMVDSQTEPIATVSGQDISSFTLATFNFIYTFTTDDASEIYYEIDFESDEDYSNNTSEPTALYVQPEGTYDFLLEGDYDNPYPYSGYPINNSISYSLSELLYYADDVQGTGDITGITLEYYAKTTAPYIPIKIWMGTTTETILTDWVTADQLQLVYEGIINFDSPSWEEMYFPLDTIFSYDGSENLLVMIDKGTSGVNGDVYFRTKDQNIYHKGLLTNDFNIDIDPYNPDPSLYVQRFDHIPAMRFLIHDENYLRFYTTPKLDAEKGVLYSYTVGANNFNGGDITISEGAFFPDWLNISGGGTRGTTLETVSGVPMELGDFDVQILASDGAHEATQTYTITVLPVIEYITSPQTTVMAGEDYVYNAEVTYNGFEPISFEEGVHFPNWLTLENTGDFTATISGSTVEAGFYQVDIIATDGLVDERQTFMLKVLDTPEFITDPVTLVGENLDYEYNVTVNYDGPNPVSFEAGDNFPEWLSILDNDDNTALVYGSTDQIGDYEVDLVARGYLVQSVQSYTISVGAIPQFTSVPETVIDNNYPYLYEITVDYNGTVACEIIAGTNMPAWMTLTDHGNNTATLSGTPNTVEAFDVDLIAQGEYFDDTQSFTVDVVVGIGEPLSNNIEVYPNPAEDYFYITDMNNATIHLFDMTGKLMRKHKVTSNNFRISVSGLEDGIYVIKAIKDNNVITKKIIIN